MHPREHSNQLFHGHPFLRNLQAFVPVHPVSMWTFHFQPVCDVRVRTWEEMRLYDLLVFTFFLISHVPSWSSTWVKDPGPSSPSELTFCLFWVLSLLAFYVVYNCPSAGWL